MPSPKIACLKFLNAMHTRCIVAPINALKNFTENHSGVRRLILLFLSVMFYHVIWATIGTYRVTHMVDANWKDIVLGIMALYGTFIGMYTYMRAPAKSSPLGANTLPPQPNPAKDTHRIDGKECV